MNNFLKTFFHSIGLDCLLPVELSYYEKDYTEIFKKVDYNKIKTNPQSMYFLSLSAKRKLPEELHSSMLLWSYSSEFKDLIKNYLDWVKVCEEREVKKIAYYIRKKRQETFLLCCMSFCFFALVFLLGLGFLA